MSKLIFTTSIALFCFLLNPQMVLVKIVWKSKIKKVRKFVDKEIYPIFNFFR